MIGPLANCGVSMAASYVMTRSISGIVLSGVVTGIDEILIVGNLASKHYLTTTIFYSTLLIASTLPFGLSLFSFKLAVVTASIAVAYYTDDILPFSAPTQETLNSLHAIKSLFESNNILGKLHNDSWETFIKYYSLKFGVNVVKTFSTLFIDINLNVYHSKLLNSLYTMSATRDAQNLKSFLKLVLVIVELNVLQVIVKAIESGIQNYFNQIIVEDINQQITNMLLTKENSLKLLRDELGKNIIRTVYTDFNNVYQGSILINNYFSDIMLGIYGLSKLYRISPDSLLYNIINNYFLNKISEYLTYKHQIIRERLIILEANKERAQSDMIESIKQVILQGGQEFFESNFNIYGLQISQLKADDAYWTNIMDLYNSVRYNLDFMFFLMLSGVMVYQERLHVDDRFNFCDYLSNINSILSIKSKFASKNKDSIISLERIKSVELIVARNNTYSPEYIFNNDDKIKLSNLYIYKNSHTLSFIKELELDIGKSYALTGASGTGKTSTLIKIMGIQNDGIDASGLISYPLYQGKPAKMFMIPQEVYIPFNSTLAEVVYYPQIFPKEIKEKRVLIKEIKSMMQYLNIDGQPKNDLNSKDSAINMLEETGIEWSKILSGGQRKKIAIVSALLSNSKILIFDEVFNGLDGDSIMRAQILIKKCTSSVLLLTVDHNAENNNNNFYDMEIYFTNNDISARALISKSTNQEKYLSELDEVTARYIYKKIDDPLSSINVNSLGSSVILHQNQILEDYSCPNNYLVDGIFSEKCDAGWDHV